MVDIKLENVKKHYGDVVALKQIDLEIKDKEFMVLVGPSGCGKSTTLNIIAGLEFVTDGKVAFGGHDVTNLGPKDRKVAMVFQSYALYPHMDAFENMAFGLQLSKVDEEEIKKRVTDAAEILEISDLLERKPKNLSGGQRQRIALGRAIVRDPTAFLLDEPLSNLDAKLRVTMRAEIKKLHRRLKTTFVYVTHDQVEAMSMADRITIMHKGDIQQVGTPVEVYNNPANVFVGGFIGSPAMNFVNTTLTQQNGQHILQVGNYDYKLPKDIAEYLSDKKDLILGIRPEHIQISDTSINENDHLVINDVVEYLGSDTLVRVLFKDDEDETWIGALAEGKYDGEIGEDAYIYWPPEVMHIFDPGTEENLMRDFHQKVIEEQA